MRSIHRVLLLVSVAPLVLLVHAACSGPQSGREGAGPDAPAALSPGAGGPLGYLAALRSGRSARLSSGAPKRSSNRDNRLIPPGKTLVLADIAGPATIHHIWMTFPEPGPSWLGRGGNANHSELVLRIYWDGGAEPAVESPVGDFFAAGFGQRAEVNSAPVQVEGGDSYNCYWPMPFHKLARIEIENQSAKPLGSFYYQIDYVKEESLPPDTPYFCAQYRQEFPTQSGRDYVILDAQGRGHYVGTVLSVRSRSPQWFGEGDDKFYIDGENTPSLWGTGTEDYVGNAWGMAAGTHPYFGVPILEGEWGMVGYRTTVYRWHLPDPVRFTKSLRAEIEDAGWISKDELKEGVHEGFVERNDDFGDGGLTRPRFHYPFPAAMSRRFLGLWFDRRSPGENCWSGRLDKVRTAPGGRQAFRECFLRLTAAVSPYCGETWARTASRSGRGALGIRPSRLGILKCRAAVAREQLPASCTCLWPGWQPARRSAKNASRITQVCRGCERPCGRPQ